MKLTLVAGLGGLFLAGCVSAPQQHAMASKDACMAKMHPKDANGAPREMTAEEKTAMMKDCPMMKGAAGMPNSGANEPRDHGAGDTHKQ